MLESRRSAIGKYERERNKLMRKVDALDSKIRELGGNGRSGRGGGGGGGRARNAKSLTEVLVEVLGRSSEPMKVGDIADKVEATGYRSSSANFRGIVNQTLIKDKRFTSASRGLYHLKK
jgi:hypothetical protein